MATYDRASYAPRFTEDYKEIQVVTVPGEELEASYDLQASSQCVMIALVDGDFAIGYESEFDVATNTIDVGAGTTLAFDNTQTATIKFSGIGILDLRDMRPGLYNMSYDLACNAFQLKYVSGPFALRLKFSNLDCVTCEPIEE